jgi:hypothetical protein
MPGPDDTARQTSFSRSSKPSDYADLSAARQPEADHYQRMAELCIAAGADKTLIQRWINVGRQRAKGLFEVNRDRVAA